MFYLSRLRLSASLSSLSSSAFLLSVYLFVFPRLFVCSSFRVSPISLRFSRLFVFPSLSSSRLSHIFVSPSSPRRSIATVSVARQLPSPRLGHSRLRPPNFPSKSLLKTTTYISRRNN